MNVYETIDEAIQKAVGKANTPELRAQITKEIADRLNDSIRFQVICDETLNPPCVVAANELRGMVIVPDDNSPKEYRYKFRISSGGVVIA